MFQSSNICTTRILVSFNPIHTKNSAFTYGKSNAASACSTSSRNSLTSIGLLPSLPVSCSSGMRWVCLCQFVARIQALTVVNQSKVWGSITVVSIDLNKKIRGNIQSNFHQTQGLVEHIHADEVLAPLEFHP